MTTFALQGNSFFHGVRFSVHTLSCGRTPYLPKVLFKYLAFPDSTLTTFDEVPGKNQATTSAPAGDEKSAVSPHKRKQFRQQLLERDHNAEAALEHSLSGKRYIVARMKFVAENQRKI
uniref:Uncharacterized protein n=1 Tax=Romanomermis culicivorax TaxID=13658 RepID=A0A915J198_ROMCU